MYDAPHCVVTQLPNIPLGTQVHQIIQFRLQSEPYISFARTYQEQSLIPIHCAGQVHQCDSWWYTQGIPEERSIFREVIVSVILSKQAYIYIGTCVLFRTVSEIELFHSTVYTVQTSHTPCPHTSCKVH
jgi:hypothetical protein